MPLCVGKRWRLAIWALTNSLLISRYLRIRVAPPEFKGYVRALDLKLVQNPRVMRDVSVWGRRLRFRRKVLFLFFSKSRQPIGENQKARNPQSDKNAESLRVSAILIFPRNPGCD